jgi:hypothetical protein
LKESKERAVADTVQQYKPTPRRHLGRRRGRWFHCVRNNDENAGPTPKLVALMSLPSLAARGTVRPFPSALSFCAATANSSGADLFACACSSLTGDEWRGRIALLDARTLRPRATISTASGVVDLQWLDGCDQIFLPMPLSNILIFF